MSKETLLGVLLILFALLLLVLLVMTLRPSPPVADCIAHGAEINAGLTSFRVTCRGVE